MKRFLRWLGCYVSYDAKVLGDPVQSGNSFSYPVKLIKKRVCVFGVCVYSSSNDMGKITMSEKFLKAGDKILTNL